MIEMPGESDAVARIAREFHQEFEFADRIYNYWLSTDRQRAFESAECTEGFLMVVHALDLQVLRLFRSVIEACARSEALVGDILSRSLFETVLALKFVCEPNIRVRALACTDKSGKPKLHASTLEPMYYVQFSRKKGMAPIPVLDRETRARIYCAFGDVEATRVLKRLSPLSGQKRVAGAIRRAISPNVRQTLDASLGPEWSYIVRYSDSYNGMKVAETAKLLGKLIPRWMAIVYSRQSASAHGSNALRHVWHNIEGLPHERLASSSEDVRWTLKSVFTWMLIAIETITRTLAFPNSSRMIYEGLSRQFLALPDL